MQEGIDNDEFIENAEFSGNMYGTRYIYLYNPHLVSDPIILLIQHRGTSLSAMSLS